MAAPRRGCRALDIRGRLAGMGARLRAAAIGGILTASVLGACVWVEDPSCPPEGLVSCDEVWIQILGPRGWQPEETYSVELAEQALVLDGLGPTGLGAMAAPSGGEVRVYRVDTCGLLTSFIARPGSIHRIRFDDSGRPTVSQVDPDEPIELGPGIETVEPSGCGG